MSYILDSIMRTHTRAHTNFNSNGKRPLQSPNPLAKRFLYMMNNDFEQEVQYAQPETKSSMVNNGAFSDAELSKRSCLLDLPVELRIRIMEYLLVGQPDLLATIHHYHQDSVAESSNRTISPPPRTYHPLHLTCKSLQQEFSKIQLEQATHVFHQPPAIHGIYDPDWFKSTATHPIRHVKVVVEYLDDKRKVEDVVGCINDAFRLLYPSYRHTFPEAETVDFVHVFCDAVNKATTSITPHPDQHTLTNPFSTSTRFDFWTKTERAPMDIVVPGTGAGAGAGGVGAGAAAATTGASATEIEEEGILSINNLHRLPALFPEMVRFDVDWTVTHTSAMGRLRFRARSVARVVSETMKAFVDLGRMEAEPPVVVGGGQGGWGRRSGKRATLQLRSINSDYGGTTQDLDFDTDRNL
ncbi:hypothetical protein FKW77_009721 [Venturia effusa]|uniref:F-box domain-containing protein n=1 Tax=Venturia effusa TaxID=50376 RepID=A0A517L238_9PEZI|nr:hypothetical protein FKW77_009721 [Venturia effusa]